MRVLKTLDIGAVKAIEIGRDDQSPVVVYVHGGPGSHCHIFARALQELPAYAAGAFTWLLFDQRGCGRSAPHHQGVTHQDNIDDLNEVLAHAVIVYGPRLRAVVGHSYGAWLVYDTFTAEVVPRPFAAVLIGLDGDRAGPRQRNFLIEMIEAKIKAPEAYQAFLEALPAFVDENSWRAKDQLRSIPYVRDMRRHFYWADPKAMAWYETTRQSLDVRDNDEIFVQVRDSIYEGGVETFDMRRLPQGSLRVLGYQDFLMRGETADDRPDTLRFLRSGHYPHIEQADDFAAVLNQRLGGPS